MGPSRRLLLKSTVSFDAVTDIEVNRPERWICDLRSSDKIESMGTKPALEKEGWLTVESDGVGDLPSNPTASVKRVGGLLTVREDRGDNEGTHGDRNGCENERSLLVAAGLDRRDEVKGCETGDGIG
jgi:hypothetical protein